MAVRIHSEKAEKQLKTRRKFAFVSPDGFSILNLFGALIETLSRDGGWDIVAISGVDKHIVTLHSLGVRHIPVPLHRYIHPWRDMRLFFSLLRIFRKEKFDLVLNFTLKPIAYGALSARLSGVPTVVSAFRGLGRTFETGGGLRSGVLKSVVLLLLRAACRSSDRVWFTNSNDAEYFRRARIVRDDQLMMTKNGVDTGKFSMISVDPDRLAHLREALNIPQDALVVVMVARLVWAKGIREFTQAARTVAEKRPRARFLLVGPLEEGTPDHVPESFLSDEARLPHFQWLGFREDVRDLYALADIAVLPSYYKEGGYPRALLEPMALGKPVVTTDTPECRGPVDPGRNGLLVPPRDAQALARAVLELLDDSKKRKRFGEHSRRKVETEFDNAKIMADAYRNLAALTVLTNPP